MSTRTTASQTILIVTGSTWTRRVAVVAIDAFDPSKVTPQMIARLREIEGGLPNWEDHEIAEYLYMVRCEIAEGKEVE